MGSNIRSMSLLLLMLTLLAAGMRPSHAAERVADPAVWGVYARLVGTSWSGELGTRATRWGEGNQMIEEDATFGRSVITPGPTPGTLVLKLGSTGLHTFQGTVASDGSVLWIRDGMLKMPYRVLLQDAELLEEQVKLSGREVASVKRTLRYQQVDGPVAGSQTLAPIAAAKNNPAVAAPVAGESVVAPANAAPEAIWGIYARLIGSTLKTGKNGPPSSWRWGDGDEIIQDMNGFGLRKIRRGAAVGELVMLEGRNFDQEWKGTVAADGSVVFVPAKDPGWLLREPSRRIRLAGDVVIVEEVKVKDGRVIDAWESFRYFGQITGADHAGPAADPKPVPATTAVAASTGTPAPMVTRNGELVVEHAAKPGVVDETALAPMLPAAAAPVAALAPASHELFGPYAEVVGYSHITPEGWQIRWFQASATTIVHEVRAPAGTIENLQVIKTTGPGTLVMFRSGWCPDGVCGQVGAVVDGVAHWKEPKASGGHSGGYMDTRVWVENGALVMTMKDPAPYGGVDIYDQYPHLRPAPQRLALVKSPALTPAQLEESRVKVSLIEPLVEIEVAKALGKQASTGQRIADAQAKRQRSAERVRSFNRAMEGMNGVLNDAVAEVGTYDEAQERLNATVSNIQAQAAYERQAQAPAQQQAPPRAADDPMQVAQSQPEPQSRESATTAAEPAAPAAGKPLRFVMSISLRNQAGDKVNPTCYSNIISRPGPPGWGAPGFLPRGSAEQARETVYGLKSDFIARCRASGREITSDGNFNFQLNQTQGDEERLQQMQARYSEDVSVSL